MSNLTDSGFEPQTSRTISDVLTAELFHFLKTIIPNYILKRNYSKACCICSLGKCKESSLRLLALDELELFLIILSRQA